MLQTASDWWWGTDLTNENKQENKEDESKEINDEKSEENKEEENTDNEKPIIEFAQELKCVSCMDTIVKLFKLIDFENAIKTLLIVQFENKLSEKESEEILFLFNAIYKIGIATNWHLRVYFELKIGGIILCYFASLSDTNPSPFGCWQRWIKYRANKQICENLKTVQKANLENFYATQSNEIGFDNNGRLIWFVSTDKYDGYIDDNTQRKAVILFMQSFFWDIKKNKLDLHILRHGISSHINLSQWSMNMVGWTTVYAIKDAMVAFPYALKDIHILNPPMFVYLVKTVAAQFFTAHSLDKFIILEDQNEFFSKYAPCDKTPAIADGTSKITVCKWMKERGYV